jgi:ABC-type transport system involved in multi-copper enzyme maturation permease subunit
VTAAPASAPAGTPSAVPPGRGGFGNLLVSEWTKIRSVRSTVWTLLLFVVITIGLTVLVTALTSASWDSARRPELHARVLADPVSIILGSGLGLGQLTICVLGVLVISTEYSTGVIRASLLAAPRRLPMLAAKLIVFALLIVVAGEIVAFASFFTGAAILHSHVAVSLSDPNVTRAVVGAGLYLTVLGLFAVGIGALIRHTAGAISAVIGIVLVVPIITSLLPSNTWDDHINAYLPSNAGTLVGHTIPAPGDLLTAWQGFGVECIWAAVALIVAAVLLMRRDA